MELIPIQGFSLEDFITQFDVDPKIDPKMHQRYTVGPDDTDFLQHYLDGRISYNFSTFGYVIEALENDLS